MFAKGTWKRIISMFMAVLLLVNILPEIGINVQAKESKKTFTDEEQILNGTGEKNDCIGLGDIRDVSENNEYRDDISGSDVSTNDFAERENATIMLEKTVNGYTWSLDTNGHFKLENYHSDNSDFDANVDWGFEEYKDLIKSASIVIDKGFNFKGLFMECHNMISAEVYVADASAITDMSSMFKDCENLQKVIFDAYKTANVTSTEEMFSGCVKLNSIDLNIESTKNVRSMKGMFSSCASLEELDVSSFNTANVYDMSEMFAECTKLKYINVSNFDTRKVVWFGKMFFQCKSLMVLDVSNFNTSNAANMSLMFAGCELLTVIDVSNFDTKNVLFMLGMFSFCEKVRVLDVSNFDTKNVVEMRAMFCDCQQIKKLDLSNFDTRHIKDMSGMFAECIELEEVDVTSFDTSQVTTMQEMFADCKKLTRLDLSSFNAKKLRDYDYMFANCNNIKILKTIPNVQNDNKIILPFALYDVNNKKYTNMPQNLGYSIWLAASSEIIPNDVHYEENIYEVMIGDSVRPILTQLPQNEDPAGFKYKSFDDDVATVDKKGEITGISIGSTTIFAKSGNYTANCKVNVIAKLEFVTTDMEIIVGDEVDTELKNIPKSVKNTDFSYRSLDEEVATVDKNGHIIAVNPGKTIIEAYCGKYTAQCNITVLPELCFEREIYDFCVGYDYNIKLINCPSNVQESAISYAVSDNTVASINKNGTVTTITLGCTKVTATYNGHVATCTINVIDAPSFEKDKYDIDFFEDFELTIVGLPEDVKQQSITYEVSDSSVLVVKENNTVMGIKNGTVILTAICGKYKFSCEITVRGKELYKSGAYNGCYWGLVQEGAGYKLIIRDEIGIGQNIDWIDYKGQISSIDMDVSFYENPSNLFNGYAKLKYATIKIDRIEKNQVRGLFKDCYELSDVKLSGFSGLEDAYEMFRDCGNGGLNTQINISNLDTSKLMNTTGMFYNCKISHIDMANFDVSKVCSMARMFSESGFIMLDLSKWDTSNVTNMSRMFFKCTALTGVKLTDIDASKVTDMSNMFSGCTLLTDVELKGMDTSNVTNMSSMFSGCTALTNISLSDIDTSKVTDMSSMFSGCKALMDIDLTDIDTSKVIDMNNMFSGCTVLTDVNLTGVDTSNVTDMSSMFSECAALKNVCLMNIDTSNVTDMRYMFSKCTALEELKLKGINADSVTNVTGMFYKCLKLKKIDLQNIDAPHVTSLNNMFGGCSGLEDINLVGINIPNANVGAVFSGCSKLKKISMQNIDISNATGLSGLFSHQSQLVEINLQNIDAADVSNMSNMFYGCTALAYINFKDINASNVTDMSRMFSGCSKLIEVNLQNINAINVEDVSCMFLDCASLTDITLIDINIPNANMSSLFEGCKKLMEIELQNVDTSNVTDMSYMFHGCTSLRNIKLYDINTSNVKNMSNMFDNCISLEKVDLTAWNTSKVSNMSNMFRDCKNLREADLYRLDFSNVKNIDQMFYNCGKLELINFGDVSGNNIEHANSVFWGCTLKYVKIMKNLNVSIELGCTMYDQGKKLYRMPLKKTESYWILGANDIYPPEPMLQDKIFVFEGYNRKIDISIPEGVDKSLIRYSSSNEEIAKIDNEGNIFGIKVGSTNINMTYKDIIQTCSVEVLAAPAFEYSNYKMVVGEEKEVVPEKFPFDKIGVEDTVVESSNSEVVVVKDGKCVALKEGKVELFFSLKNSNYSNKCTIEVKPIPSFENSEYEIVESESIRLMINNYPEWIDRSEVIFKSTNDEVVSVDKEGNIVALKAGTAKINAMIGKYTITTNINVLPKPYFYKSDYVVMMGKTLQIKLLNTESNTKFSDYTFSISDNSILTLDESGIITPLAPGSADVYACYKNHSNIIWKCRIEVIQRGFYIEEIDDVVYNGTAQKPKVIIYNDEYYLVEGKDYTVKYSNNIAAADKNSKKAPKATISFKGNYSGKVEKYFNILPYDANGEDLQISFSQCEVVENGRQQKIKPIIMYKGKKLILNKDYTLYYPLDDTYNSYTAPGVYDVKVNFKNNFYGSKTLKFNIKSGKTITNAKINIISKIQYTGEACCPLPIVIANGMLLCEDIDYIVSYENNILPGRATIKIKGIGAYVGEKTCTFEIVGNSISKAQVTGVENKIYNGTEQTQNIKISLDNGETYLVLNKDYKITYEKNLNVGMAKMKIIGIGGYTGNICRNFKILPYNISTDNSQVITGIPQNIVVSYVKGGCKPEVALCFNGQPLDMKKDVTISYSNNAKLGVAGDGKKAPTIIIKGKGNFTGTCLVKFTIAKNNLGEKDTMVKISIADVAVADKAGKYVSVPVLVDANGKKLTAGVDYEKAIVYVYNGKVLDPKSDKVPVGGEITAIVTGKGNYEGVIRTQYHIAEKRFDSAKVIVAPKEYTGKKVTLGKDDITVKLGKDILKYGVDYEVVEDSYANNTDKGNASVVIKGIGIYGGMKTIKYVIHSKSIR